MKANYASAILLLFTLGDLQAQFINVTNGQGQVVNGQLVTVTGPADSPLITCSLNATRNGSTSVNVNVKRYETDVQAGTQNYFCWGVCYDAIPAGTLPFWGAGQESVLPMAPGVTLDNFHAYHVPLGQAGLSTFRYVWYNTANTNDSVFVDIRFDVAAVGIDEVAARAARIEAYPNPAIGQDALLEVSIDRSGAPAQLIVHDMLGAVVKRYTVGGQQLRIALPTSEWTPGVYFVSLERGGALLATRRLVVAR